MPMQNVALQNPYPIGLARGEGSRTPSGAHGLTWLSLSCEDVYGDIDYHRERRRRRRIKGRMELSLQVNQVLLESPI